MKNQHKIDLIKANVEREASIWYNRLHNRITAWRLNAFKWIYTNEGGK